MLEKQLFNNVMIRCYKIINACDPLNAYIAADNAISYVYTYEISVNLTKFLLKKIKWAIDLSGYGTHKYIKHSLNFM